MLSLLQVAAVAAAPPLDLIVLPNGSSVDLGAVCLDGSAPAIYYLGANATADPSARSRWLLYFKGGGWCYDEEDCARRALTSDGSTKGLSETGGFSQGIMSRDPAVNPLFANAHHVELWYCDGGSFTGDRTEPVEVNGTQVFFRGKRILDAILSFLMLNYKLDEATEVLLAGGSAGGLSTFLHADYVRSQFGPNVKFGAAPVSGFFLMHDTVQGVDAYPSNMQYVYNMMNSSGGVNQRCRAAAGASGNDREAWQCIFANSSYAHTQVPIFPLQSSVDKWQLGVIFQLDQAGNRACSSPALAPGGYTEHQLANCTALQRRAVVQYERDFLRDLQASETFSRAGNGGYIESCVEHVAGQGPAFNIYRNGASGLTMQQALAQWWRSGFVEPAAKHWQMPCMLHLNGSFGQCNPSCTAAA